MNHSALTHLLLFVTLLLATACGGNTDKSAADTSREHGATYFRLEKGVRAINKQCPISLGGSGTMTSAKLNRADNTVTFTIDMPDSRTFDLTAENPHLRDIIASSLAADIDPDDTDDLTTLAIDNNTDIIYLYRCHSPKRQHTVTVTAHELRQAAADTASTVTKARRLIDMTAGNYRSRCPIRINDHMTLSQVSVSSDTVLYEYTVSDRLSELEYDYDPQKDLIIDLIRHEPGMNREAISIRDAGYTLIIRYTSAFPRRSIDIPFPNLELHYILSDNQTPKRRKAL